MKTKPMDTPIILASRSPRRKDLLQQAGLSFTVKPSNIDENTISFDSPDAYVKALAKVKANDVGSCHPDNWIIGADTIVLIDGKILGKPGSKKEALTMLSLLSGRIHQVFTGFCICLKSRSICYTEAVKTDVEFKPLTHEEIQWYISTKEPYDKAGGYAIQELGSILVKAISGSYTNVVGLPVCEVLGYLLKKDIVALTDLKRC